MTNHHFGKLADVWKHLVLNEVLAGMRPERFAETHAGSASYPMVDDPERAYGILGYLESSRSTPLDAAPFTRVVSDFALGADARYPGSAVQAMSALGNDAAYLLCDLDPISADSLRDWAARQRVRECVVVESDGMAAVRDWLPATVRTVVHIDPFDPFARCDGAPSAIELAAEVAESGHALVYWYGYGEPSSRGWAFDAIRSGTDAELWVGDLLVTGADGEVRDDGDLGEATTAGTGSGVVLANVPAGVIDTCTARARDLVTGYEGKPLPSGELGRLEVTCGRHRPGGVTA